MARFCIRAVVVAIACVATTPAVAQVCPAPQDASDLRATLHSDLLQAETEGEARETASKLWEVWLTAPDAVAQDLLDRAMARRESYDLAGAEGLLDQLTAFVRFLRQNYDGALSDLDTVLTANPYHFGALSGKALSLMGLGRMALAQDVLRDALKVHPFLQERAYLTDLDDDI